MQIFLPEGYQEAIHRDFLYKVASKGSCAVSR